MQEPDEQEAPREPSELDKYVKNDPDETMEQESERDKHEKGDSEGPWPPDSANAPPSEDEGPNS